MALYHFRNLKHGIKRQHVMPHYPEKIKNATMNGHFGICLKIAKSQSDYRHVIVLEKIHFQNVFCPYEDEKRL